MEDLIRSSIVYLCVLGLVSGCTYYDASLLEKPGGDAGMDAPADAPVEADASDDAVDAAAPVDVVADLGDVEAESEAEVCGHAKPPDPPAVTGLGGDLEFVTALSEVDFGDLSSAPKELGYDLDYRCTCQGDVNGCLRESWATADACDGPDGRDNQIGVLVSQLGPLVSGFGSQEWTDWAYAGEWNLLLRVRGYNGLADDDNVRLDWYVADEYWLDKPNNAYKPKWDGTDTWPVRATSLEDGNADLDHPKHFDDHAYVSGGVLVASLEETSFKLNTGYEARLLGAFVTARVVQGPSGWVLEDGVITGRWKLVDVLGQMGRIPLLSIPICMDHPSYSSIKAQVCAIADMYSGVGSPTTPCDSASAAFSFQGVHAGLGSIWQDTLLPNPCAAEFDPATDSCDNL